MNDRDTYRDELATSKTQVDLPAIPRTDPPDRVSSGDLGVEFTDRPRREPTAQQVLDTVVARQMLSDEREEWLFRTVKRIDERGARQENDIAQIRDFMTVGALKSHHRATDDPEELSGAVLLLVEDNKPLLNSWRPMLTEEGAAVHVARSAHEARYKLETLDSVLTCCVLDVHLQDEQGFGLAQWTRHRLPRVGIVIASGWSEFDLDSAAHKLRAAALSKPFSHRSTIDAILAAQEIAGERAAE